MSSKIINDQIGSRGSTFVRPLNIAYNAGGSGGILPTTLGTEGADAQRACAQKFDIGQSCLPSIRDGRLGRYAALRKSARLCLGTTQLCFDGRRGGFGRGARVACPRLADDRIETARQHHGDSNDADPKR